MARLARLLWPGLLQKFGYGQANQAFVARVTAKAWLWPAWPGFTKPHFPGKLGLKPGKPGLARLCQAGRVFDRALDAREDFTLDYHFRLIPDAVQTGEAVL